jgi:TIR domain
VAGVFVSHASHDKPLVDPFVDDVIRLGCEVPRQNLFYSSGEDTGVPSGEDLNSYVRKEVAEASIVVAIISPAFQSRPFCIAELGAAWSRTENLFPIAVPEMRRTDLEGVLSGMLVNHLDDSAALDELHARITAALGHTPDVRTWGRFKEKWLANVHSYAAQVPKLRTVTVREVEQVEGQLRSARDALGESEEDRRTLQRQVEQLKEAKSAKDVADILLPEEEVDRFKALQSTAATAARELPVIVIDAMWHDLFEHGMPWPNRFDDQAAFDSASDAEREGILIENGYDLLQPDQDVREVAAVYNAVERLRALLDDATPEFVEWFREKYGMSPNLRKKKLWDQLLSEGRMWR